MSQNPAAGGKLPPSNMAKAIQAIFLVISVVVFNLIIYFLILLLTSTGYLGTSNAFPALVLFLSFAMSLGIILIVALGEKVDTKNIQNKWIKKIGVTPIMTIVAVIISIFAGFSSFADKIIPPPPPPSPSDLKFMLANVGVSCLVDNRDKSPQATSLLTVISSPEEDYIKSVKEFLVAHAEKNLIEEAKWEDLQFVDPVRGDITKLLRAFADTHERGSDSLGEDLRHYWVAYTVKVHDAVQSTTFVPIPTIFARTHKSRLFVVVTEGQKAQEAEVASLTAVAAPKLAVQRVLPLVQFEIRAELPHVKSQLTNLGVEVYADHVCWNIGL